MLVPTLFFKACRAIQPAQWACRWVGQPQQRRARIKQLALAQCNLEHHRESVRKQRGQERMEFDRQLSRSVAVKWIE